MNRKGKGQLILMKTQSGVDQRKGTKSGANDSTPVLSVDVSVDVSVDRLM